MDPNTDSNLRLVEIEVNVAAQLTQLCVQPGAAVHHAVAIYRQVLKELRKLGVAKAAD